MGRSIRRLAPPSNVRSAGTVYARPRVARWLYLNDTTQLTTNAREYARYDFVVVSFTNTSLTGPAIAAVKAINPNTKFLRYQIPVENNTLINPVEYQAAVDNNWFLYNAAGQRIRSFTFNQTTHPVGAFNTKSWPGGAPFVQYGDAVRHGGIDYWCVGTPANALATTPGTNESVWTTNMNAVALNYTDLTTRNGLGENLMEYRARRTKEFLDTFTGAAWDGIYHDGYGYVTNGWLADWNKNGVDWDIENTGSPQAAVGQANARAAHALYITKLREFFGPGFLLIANGQENGTGPYYGQGTEFFIDGNMKQYTDGVLTEGSFGRCLNWFKLPQNGVSQQGGGSVMYSTWEDFSKSGGRGGTYGPNRSALMVRLKTWTEYDMMRLGVALALMTDGMPAIIVRDEGDSNSAFNRWYDEFGAELGDPIDAPQYTWGAVSQFWKRRFQNGVILINESKQVMVSRGAWAPSTSYTRGDWFTDGGFAHIVETTHTSDASSLATDVAAGRVYSTLSSTPGGYTWGPSVTIDNTIIPYNVYRRLNGSQVPSVNSGAAVSGSFSMRGWEAVFLLCLTPLVH